MGKHKAQPSEKKIKQAKVITTKSKKAKVKNVKQFKNTKNINNTKGVAQDTNETTDSAVLELVTKHPELKQTFEYVLYSNKYKHTLTDVFNIIKMLMGKLEELQNQEVDIQNIFETINLNYKIRGLIQSTAINLSHVVQQLNINESTFLTFARCFNPINTINSNQNEETVLSKENHVNHEIPLHFEKPASIRVRSQAELNNDYPMLDKIKTKNGSMYTNLTKKKGIFGSKDTVVLSSDDEIDESRYYDKYIKRSLWGEPKKSDAEDLESYAIGSDFTEILSDDGCNDVTPPTIEKRESTVPKSVSVHKTPIQTSKKLIRPKISDEAINEARKLDIHHRKRLQEQNSLILNIVKKLNLQTNDIVLEFDIANQKPSIIINKELAKVLKAHQVEGIRFLWDMVFESVEKTNLTEGTGCILAHRMGIGKTLQIIALIYTILCEPRIHIKTFLIICPPGLIYNWIDEIYKWLKDIDKSEILKVYDLPKTNKLYNITNIATWKTKGGVLVLSYENFKSLVNCKESDLREAFCHTLIDPGPDVVILDEGHYIKNTQTKLLKNLSLLKTKRRIVLTDSSDEAVKTMKERTFILHRLLRNTVHRIDDRNLKPLFTDKIEYTIEINMSEFQCELYEKFLHYDQKSNDKSNVFWRLHVLTLITLHPLTLYRLIHLKNCKQASDPGMTKFDENLTKSLKWVSDYKEDPRFFEARQSNKITFVLSIIDECQKRNEKLLCFLKSPLAMDALEYFLQQEKSWILGEQYFRMDGKTPLSIRNQMCEAFNTPENPARVFILSMGTGGLGYNMVGANRVLLLNASWNPSVDIQAIYRCLRFGQTKNVFVNRVLAKGTVEPKAYYRQISKLGMASSVVDLQHFNRKVSFSQTNDLFTFDSSNRYNTLVPNTKDPVLNQLIRCNLGSINNVKEHDSMFVESMESQLTSEERKAIWLAYKNNELGSKIIKFKGPMLQEIEQVMGIKVPENIGVGLETNDFLSISQNNLEQVPLPQFFNQSSSSYSSCSEFNRKKLSTPTGTHTNYRACDNLNRSFDEPIQNQFRNFQNKTFSQHKKFPFVTHPKNTFRHHQNTSARGAVNQNPEVNIQPRNYFKQTEERNNLSRVFNQQENGPSRETNNYRGHQSRYTSYHNRTHYNNNIHNRSGNSR
ncbi:transcriptional regulator ATRX homolog isoform X2 [Adelges cooleyi]|uniref:transcriptional regulator ATRX homolog isoform X2 n=1 Tax=Adelges cooleyi TaxID=133065 RepID=UPI00217FADF8|nr:transcriptional regulator ATRX homolog isoform X2 [Adelges cooleyi]